MILDQIRELLKNTPFDEVPEEIIINKLNNGEGFRLANVPSGCQITVWHHAKCETVSKDVFSVIDHSEVKGTAFTSSKLKDDVTIIS
jgi:hypothetical protein